MVILHFILSTILYVLKKYKDIEGTVKMEEVDGQELVKKFAEEMEEMLGRKMKSVKVKIHSVKIKYTHTDTHFMATRLNPDHYRLNHSSRFSLRDDG